MNKNGQAFGLYVSLPAGGDLIGVSYKTVKKKQILNKVKWESHVDKQKLRNNIVLFCMRTILFSFGKIN